MKTLIIGATLILSALTAQAQTYTGGNIYNSPGFVYARQRAMNDVIRRSVLRGHHGHRGHRGHRSHRSTTRQHRRHR